MSSGWIKLHRVLLEKTVWKCSNPPQKVILITLLLLASHKESEWQWGGRRFKVKKGEFVTSLESIRKSAGKDISIQQIRTALVLYVKLGFLTNVSTKHGRLITILNYEQYQSEQQSKQQSKQQSINKALTPIKKVRSKEVKEKTNKKEKDAFSIQFLMKRVCERILQMPVKNGYAFDPYKFIQLALDKNKHPQAILDSLIATGKAWDIVDSPQAYCKKILSSKSPMYNERQHTQESKQFKALWTSPEIGTLIKNIGG